ncbi:NmrA family NAD(P)-binding protein [Treponema sp.]
MKKPYRILITGATGNVGEATIEALGTYSVNVEARPLEIVAAVRDPARFATKKTGISAVRFDFMDTSTWSTTLEGLDALLLVRPPAISNIDKSLGPFIRELSARGTQNSPKIVFLSLQGVQSMPYVPHAKVEKCIRQSGLPFVMLQPSFFMQNVAGTHRQEIAERGEIFIPAGKGRTNFIDARDIGEVAAKVLVENGHEGKAYELTGSDVLDYYEVASILTEVLGKPIRYLKPSLLRFLITSIAAGMDASFAFVQAGIYLAAALGKAEGTTQTVEKLLGKKPRTFRAFVQDSKKQWASS